MISPQMILSLRYQQKKLIDKTCFMSKKIIPFSQPADEGIIKSLQKTIARKRKTLLLISAKVEMLTIDLDIIKREYQVRIGKLYIKDDQLDMEIIRYKNIKNLIGKGYTYDETIKKINEKYYAEKKIFDERMEYILRDEETLSKRDTLKTHTQQDIKKLWKKLLFQLHPDLTTQKEEKKKREIIMKKINDAYTENDFEKLKNIENQHYVEPIEQTSIGNLEKTIENIEQTIWNLEEKYQQLRASEWYTWRKKSQLAKKRKKDIFKELEEHLLEDVVRKITIVNTYRKEFDQKGYY